MILYYDICFGASLALMLLYMLNWHKHFDVHVTLIYVLVPIANLGHCLVAHATSEVEVLTAIKLTYVGGCYLMPTIMLTVFSLCDIQLGRWLKALIMCIESLIYLAALTIGNSKIFYEDVKLDFSDGVIHIQKEYGVLHDVFYAAIALYFLMSIIAIVYSYFKKTQVSRKILFLLFLPVAVCIFSFFGFRELREIGIELLSAAYVFALVVYLVIVRRLSLYDVTDNAIDSLVQTGDTGLISVDFKHNYLGSNGTAKVIFPDLHWLTVDKTLEKSQAMQDTVLNWINTFKNNEKSDHFHYENEDKSYLVTVSYLYDGRRRCGYQIFMTDDTEDHKYIQLLNHYNSDLQAQVAEKTEHIVEMHDNLILSMAVMVESRDNSTGGHIRRTSELVRMLVDCIDADPDFVLSPEFCRDIVKAAPMHDLGKISVDDAILRKPGRFTPEEFEKMKAHAAEGARIVHEILKGTDDADFRRIAENVAHYHHERWDGSGYPMGLKGEEIPLEARIMAIADVYDALVSKRVYKESMSFEKADSIIMEGMGKHFDKQLEPYYVQVRPAFERYYTEQSAQE